jgi:hypothetical protein
MTKAPSKYCLQITKKMYTISSAPTLWMQCDPYFKSRTIEHNIIETYTFLSSLKELSNKTSDEHDHEQQLINS